MSRVVRVSTAMLLSAVCACGGATTAGPDDSTTAQDVESYCETQCDHNERCNPNEPPESSCRSSCAEDLGRAAPHVRAGYVRTYTSCMSQLDCGEGSDACREEAKEAIGATTAAVDAAPDVRTCREKQTACKETSGSFDDEVCDNLLLLVPGSRSQIGRCFQDDCETIPACLEPVFGET